MSINPSVQNAQLPRSHAEPGEFSICSEGLSTLVSTVGSRAISGSFAAFTMIAVKSYLGGEERINLNFTQKSLMQDLIVGAVVGISSNGVCLAVKNGSVLDKK